MLQDQARMYCINVSNRKLKDKHWPPTPLFAAALSYLPSHLAPSLLRPPPLHLSHYAPLSTTPTR